MRHSKVGTVMTSDVVQVRSGTPFKEVARLLARYRVRGLPVVDDERGLRAGRLPAGAAGAVVRGITEDWIRRL